jgi:adenosine deaminase
VFSTTLSEEYALAAEGFGLSREDLWSISEKAIGFTFLCEQGRAQLRQVFASRRVEP